jgi:hypothetical protein
MTWTTPVTWTADQVVGASDMNTQVRDNLNHLHSGKPFFAIIHIKGSNYSTSSSTLADIDSTNIKADIVTTTGRLEIAFSGTFFADASARQLHLTVNIDGTDIINVRETLDTNSRIITLVTGKTGLAAGSRTVKIRWSVDAGTAFLASDSGTQLSLTVKEI